MINLSLPQIPTRFNPQGQSRTPIYVAGRTAGYVYGDAFRKTVRGSKHMLRTPRAWASDIAALAAAAAAGATHIEIEDSESGALYRASIAEMLEHGFTFDRGFGQQIALPLDKWSRPDKGTQMDLFTMEATR